MLVLAGDRRAPARRQRAPPHVALLYPARRSCAGGNALAVAGTPIDGASDHGTHEAINLPDPDGNGLELAADRPRAQWPELSGSGAYAGEPGPLERAGLLALAGDRPAAPPRRHAAPGLAVGHVHLHVPDLGDELRFHRDVLGFDVVTALPSAVFVSAGGYHHHLAFNLWRGEGIPPAPAAGTLGLRHWTVVVDGAGELEAVRDRARQAGIAPVEHAGGLLLRDPAGIAVVVRPERCGAAGDRIARHRIDPRTRGSGSRTDPGSGLQSRG